MQHELICQWLNLPAGSWPPDHYALLGLPRGESSIARIEQRVHERMELVRRYQLPHPEPATEAMNRLAQALICLTDPKAKESYDLSLQSGSTSEPSHATPTPAAPASAVGAADPLAWLFGPGGVIPPVPLKGTSSPIKMAEWDSAPPPPRLGPTDAVETSVLPAETAGPTSAADEGGPVAPAEELTASRRGLGTRQALLHRIRWTRQLQMVWERAGKYLNRPTRTVTRPAEARDLILQMETLRDLVRGYPLPLGDAGQPGHLVLSVARLQMLVPTLQTLLPSQRQALARDWQAGRDFLRAHHRFLREEVRALRRRGRWRHALRVLGRTFVDYPGVPLVLLSLLAIDLAEPTVARFWPEQTICVVALMALRVAFWRYHFRPLRPLGPSRSAPPTQSLRPRRRAESPA